MPHRPHTPAEGEPQTDPRLAMVFWISAIISPKLLCRAGQTQEVRPATWLIRDPHTNLWRGLEIDVPPGEFPATMAARGLTEALRLTPRYIDQIAILEPSDHPNIGRTTFVHTALGGPDQLHRPKPAKGIELGFFPLDDLPVGEMSPGLKWLPDTLVEATKRPMSPYLVEFRPNAR